MNQTAQSWWFIFYKDQLLLEKKEDGIYTVPCGESSPIVIKEKTTVHNITTLERKNCKAFSLSSPIEESEQWIMIGLRASYEYLPLSHYQTAGKAHEILHWDRNSRFCSACGTPMEQKESIMKRCPKCGREAYPSISTAILVLVRKKDSLLLVHARNFKGTFNSLVAGFLETGETLEECVAREVKEETGMDATLVNPRFITGVDEALLEDLKRDHTLVVTLEDGVLDGGFGEKIARYYGASGMKVLNYGIRKEFADRYDAGELLRDNRLTVPQIVEDIKKVR